jgi:hypothetical protein
MAALFVQSDWKDDSKNDCNKNESSYDSPLYSLLPDDSFLVNDATVISSLLGGVNVITTLISN